MGIYLNSSWTLLVANSLVFFARLDSPLRHGDIDRRYWKAGLMLIISRKKNQKLVIADDVEITILEVGRNRVRFGIKAPDHIRIQTHLKTDPVSIDDHAEDLEDQPCPLDELSLAVGLSKRL